MGRRRLSSCPAVLVHGFEGYAAKDCRELAPLRAALTRRRLPGLRRRRAIVVGYYAGDTGFDVALPGQPATVQTSISELAARLTAFVGAGGGSAAGPVDSPAGISAGGPVDLVGHSMGGLVALAALPLLPAGAVRRVVLLGVPLAGLPSAAGVNVTQCVEMAPGSAWLASLPRPAPGRVDLLVGSEADEAVPIESALPLEFAARRVVRVPAARAVHHGDLVTDAGVLDEVARALR